MNVRLTNSASSLTKLFRTLSLVGCQDRRVMTGKEKIRAECAAFFETNSCHPETEVVKSLSLSHYVQSGAFSEASAAVVCFLTRSYPLTCVIRKSKIGVHTLSLSCSHTFARHTHRHKAGTCRPFSTCSHLLPFHMNSSKAGECGFFFTCSHPLTCPASKVKQFRILLLRTRQIHSCTPFHTCTTDRKLQRSITNRHSSKTRSRKRLLLSRTQEIEEVLEEYAEVIQEFAALLDCSQEAMMHMVRRDTRLVTQFDKEAVMAKMRLLMNHGFTASEILSRYQVFSRSAHHLQSRLSMMDTVKHYKHKLATLLLSDSQFKARIAAYQKEVAIMGHHSSQTSFLAELLECTPDEVFCLASQNHCQFLLTLPPSRLQEIVAVLRSFGISVADIRRKCLMLKCLPDVAHKRLQRVLDAGVFDLQLVPYILTNSDHHFESSFAKWVRNAKALGSYTNERELLMGRLHCSEADVQSLMRRKTMVAQLRSAKLERCLDILQKEIGLSSETILRQGNLLYCSPRRLLARWALLKSLGLSQAALARELLLAENKFVAKYGYGSN